MSTCEHPGCERPLGRKSKSGRCLEHLHKRGCRCSYCAPRDAIREALMRRELDEAREDAAAAIRRAIRRSPEPRGRA